MASKIDICNMALGYLGQFSISSLEQDNTPARWLNLFYNSVRDEVLRNHNWAFAAVEKPLTCVQRPAQGQENWVYKYPADALFIRRVFAGNQRLVAQPFEERMDPSLSMRVLVCPFAQAGALYTRRMTDETQYDPCFTKCFALALACDMAPVLTGDVSLAARLEQKYALCLEEARRSNMAENCMQIPQHDSFSEVR